MDPKTEITLMQARAKAEKRELTDLEAKRIRVLTLLVPTKQPSLSDLGIG